MDGLLWFQVLPIAQQQPAAGFQDFSSRPVMSQLIGLIHPHPVDHFPAVLGYDVEQVIDDFGLRAIRLDFQLVSRRHIDRDGFDTLSNALRKLLKEGTGGFPRTALSDPQHLSIDRLDDDCRVAVAFVERELIHRQITHLRPIRFDKTGRQAHLVDRFDRVPIKTVEPRHRLHVGRFQQDLAGFGKTRRDPLIASQPLQPLQSGATAVVAPNPATRYVKLDPVLEQR